jgi:hypothetical protein
MGVPRKFSLAQSDPSPTTGVLKIGSRIDWSTGRMPDVEDQNLVLCNAIVDKVRISMHWQASVPSVVNDATNARKKAQGIDGGFDSAEYIGSPAGVRSTR